MGNRISKAHIVYSTSHPSLLGFSLSPKPKMLIDKGEAITAQHVSNAADSPLLLLVIAYCYQDNAVLTSTVLLPRMKVGLTEVSSSVCHPPTVCRFFWITRPPTPVVVEFLVCCLCQPTQEPCTPHDARYNIRFLLLYFCTQQDLLQQ
jgi:hypothetical protein